MFKDDSGAKRRVVIDEHERDVKLTFKVLDTLFFNIESKHNVRNLFIKLKDETNIEFSKFEDMLIKVNRGFKRRYVINESFSLNPVTLDEIDECFFFLRSFVSDKVPPSFIDELIFKKKYNIQEPVPFFDSLFLKNRHIHSRKYLDLIDKIPDGRIIAHNGLKFKEFPSGSYEYLIKKGYLIQNRFTYLKMKS
ncbi:hypothetical protein [Algoriphagus terrigena]|uniref:hypothetical protein n=1 Tax=Algoriphagus terrigena TaxID=344884 RepID=UPI00047D7FD5|nr:hypothetical protein [Algoriphagus terrigena]